MSSHSRQELTGRSCPRCQRRTDRVARRWFDRVLSLFMPVVRYRCASPGCGWEGLLMRRHRLPGRATRPADASYRPRWLQPARMDSPPEQPRH
ncbi:MAG: hypothetical protein Q7U73_06100 [Rubrivivax sp.]|nr:hypothetical protein [Rubrivivax sp.]